MKVLHVITTMDRGGAETQLIQLVKFQSDKGFEVEIRYLKGNGALANATPDIKISRVSGRLFFIQVFVLFLLIKRCKPDIVNAHLPRSEVVSAIVTRLCHGSLVVTKHNSERFWPNGFSLVSKLLSSYVEKSACATICITRAVLDHLVSVGESNNLNYFVVHYGIQCKNFEISLKDSFRNSHNELDIICLARLEPQKNLVALIDLIPRVRDLHPKIRIFGAGSQESELSTQINKKGLSREIVLCGLTNDARSEMRKSKLLLLPSNYEGFGLVLLEALDEGCIVVATRIPAIMEVLGEDYPFLFDPQSRSEMELRVRQALLAESDWYIDYRERTLHRFTLQEQFNKTEKIYRRCIQLQVGGYES